MNKGLESQRHSTGKCTHWSIIGRRGITADALAGIQSLTLGPQPQVLTGKVKADLFDTYLARPAGRQGVAKVQVLKAQIRSTDQEAVRSRVGVLVVILQARDVRVRIRRCPSVRGMFVFVFVGVQAFSISAWKLRPRLLEPVVPINMA